jgi:hypothetical protein
MAEQQQEGSQGLTPVAAASLVGWLALYFLFWSASAPRSCGGDSLCGLGLIGPAFVCGGMGALLGIAAWLWATVSTVRRREVLSALSIGLLLPVELVGAYHAVFLPRSAVGSVAFAGSWALFGVVSATLLATSVTSRPTTRRLAVVAGLVLAVALLVASTLVG